MRLFISAKVLGLQSFAAANSVLLGMKMSSDNEENNTKHFWEIVPEFRGFMLRSCSDTTWPLAVF